MTDKKIDFQLALAIGYAPDRVRVFKTKFGGFVQVCNNDGIRCDGPMQYGGWQRFDHKEPAVFVGVAKRFDAFPMRWNECKEWVAAAGSVLINTGISECAATATALAVIEHCKKDKP